MLDQLGPTDHSCNRVAARFVVVAGCACRTTASPTVSAKVGNFLGYKAKHVALKCMVGERIGDHDIALSY
eukprot:2827460-Amphidinium_carterae.1